MSRRLLVWFLLLGSLGLLSLRLGRPVPAGERVQTLAELRILDQVGPEIPLEGDALAVLGVDAHRFVRREGRAGPPLWVYAGYYAGQRPDAQVHAPEHCYPGSGFTIVRAQSRRDGGQAVRELLVERGAERRLVWFAYRTRRGAALSPFGLKRDQILAAALGRPRDALLLRLSTPLGALEVEEDARVRLREEWRMLAPAMWAWFEKEQG